MKQTNYMKLTLPDIGSQLNWGCVVNNNFITIDREVQKLVSELNTTKNVLGVGVPYYKELYTTTTGGSTVGPYKYVYITTSGTAPDIYYNFTYYTAVKNNMGVIEGDGADITFTNDPNDTDLTHHPLNSLDKGVGAYVLNTNDISIKLGTDNAQTYYQGDLIVAISEVGSIYDTNYVQIKFVKYPDTGYYIEPKVELESLNNANTRVFLKYTKKTAIDWALRNNSVYYAPIPAYHFERKQFVSGIHEYTTTMTILDEIQDVDDFSAFVNFYTQEDNTLSPVYVQYSLQIDRASTTIDGKSATQIIVTVKPEWLVGGGCFDICIGRKIQASVAQASVGE